MTIARKDADERLLQIRDDWGKYLSPDDVGIMLRAVARELNALNKWLEEHGKRIASALEGIEINV